MLKIVSLFLLLALTIGFCIWYSKRERPLPDDKNTGIKWNDTLYRHLPKELDTTVMVEDANGTPLKFRQYIKPVFNHQAMIYRDKDVWRLQRLTKKAIDSMNKDDHAIARSERATPFYQLDMETDWRKKLDDIAHTLAQADHVLVLKSERKMFLQRRGANVLTFRISLGRVPIGKKQFDHDGKTPEGIYTLDCKYDRGGKYYKSFLISYPNDADRQYAKLKGLKPGNGVEIHGTRPGALTADWTAGCIALANKDMDSLFAYVASGTVIEIRK